MQDVAAHDERPDTPRTERRKEPRWPAYVGGRLIHAKRSATTDCIVRNRSAHGALLVCAGATHLPDDLDFLVPQRGTTQRAHVRWRRLDAIGVEIDDLPVADGAKLFGAERIRMLEAENARLRRRLLDPV